MSLPTFEDVERIELSDLPSDRRLTRRTDRKYVVSSTAATALVERHAHDLRAVSVSGSIWQRYETLYFDTGELDTLHRSLTGRRRRERLRIRSYLGSETSFIEIKRRLRSGQTDKLRHPTSFDWAQQFSLGMGVDSRLHDVAVDSLDDLAADGLLAVASTTFLRATFVARDQPARFTIDAHLETRVVDVNRVEDSTAQQTFRSSSWLVETKTDGPATSIDRSLWRLGHRPAPFSKYACSWLASDEGLPTRRYARRHHLLQRVDP